MSAEQNNSFVLVLPRRPSATANAVLREVVSNGVEIRNVRLDLFPHELWRSFETDAPVCFRVPASFSQDKLCDFMGRIAGRNTLYTDARLRSEFATGWRYCEAFYAKSAEKGPFVVGGYPNIAVVKVGML